MFKKTTLRLLLCMMACISMPNLLADTLTINTAIDKVTIYKQGALVSRKAHIKVPAGVSVHKIQMVSPVLDKKSVQVGITNSDITLGKVDVDVEMPNRDFIAHKNDSLKKISSVIEDSINLIASYNKVLDNEKSVLLANDDIGGKKGFNAEQLSAIAEFLRKDLDEIIDKQLVYKQKREKYELDKQLVGQEILLLDERAMEPKGAIFVTLVSPSAAETDVDIKYMVKEAEWTPFFELRLAEGQSTLEVTKKVMVLQKSKEDWNDVKMTVTRTNPSENNARPELKRYTLPKKTQTESHVSSSSKEMIKVMGNVRDEKGSISGVLVTCPESNTSTQTDKSGFYEILVPAESYLIFTHATHTKEKIFVRSSSLVENVVMQEDAKLVYGNKIKLRGVVRDYEDVLPGASVVIKGTTEGASTDMDGNFELDVSYGSTIEISYIGYETKTLKITATTPHWLDIKLGVDENMTEEVVVVGYGVQKKSNGIKKLANKLTGAVSNIREEKLKETVPASIDQALNGRVSGVQVTESSGLPGVASSVHLRGTNSLTGDNDPLYVVDGVPLVSTKGNPLSDISPADIVAMEVLKDQSATAIYGSRAVNGVVFITTRKGASVGSEQYLSLFSKLQDYTAEASTLNTIPSDGSEHEAMLEKISIPVEYSYYAAPKMTPNVYMIAEIPKWKDHELLAGKLRVFLNNAYIGESYWTPNEIEDSLKFSVGVEKDIAVERILKSTTNQRKGLLKMNNKIYREWQIVVKNNKETAIKHLIVRDQIPVSTRKDVKVELIESSNARVDEQWGSVIWDLQLAPNEKKTLSLIYEVTVKNEKDYDDLKDDEDL